MTDLKRKRDPERFIAHRRALDKVLVEHGFIETPPVWWEIIERFERSQKRRLVIRKGRRVGASTMIAPRQVVCEALWGEHYHTPGTPALVYAFLSVTKEEAANRLTGIKAILDVLDIDYSSRGSEIELHDFPALFKVVPANYRRAVGETVAFCWCDELTRWIDDKLSKNPASEVVQSIAPALGTLVNAKMWLVSSALGHEDYHAQQYSLGETAGQCTAFGATWDLNPTLSEEETKTLEPDEKIWLREYAAVPQGSDTDAFPFELIQFALTRGWPVEPFRQRGIITTDFSSGMNDDTVRVFAGWKNGLKFTHHVDKGRVFQNGTGQDRTDWFDFEDVEIGYGKTRKNPIFKPAFQAVKNPQLCFGPFHAWERWYEKGITLEHICHEIADHAKQTGAWWAVGDIHQDRGIEIFLSKEGIRFEPEAVTTVKKTKAAVRFRNLLASRQVCFYEDDKILRSQLGGFREVVTPNGIKFTGKVNGAKDDYVGAILNAMIAEEVNVFPGSPVKSGFGRVHVHHDDRS